jgi:hypothetical protein
MNSSMGQPRLKPEKKKKKKKWLGGGRQKNLTKKKFIKSAQLVNFLSKQKGQKKKKGHKLKWTKR